MEFNGFIDIIITRKWFYRDFVIGIMEIPFYGFKCYCMEHKQDNFAKMKLNVALPHSQYLMKPVVKNGTYPTPQVSHRLKGWVKSPYICPEFTQLKDLPTGCITIGKKTKDNKLEAYDKVSENFKKIMQKAFQRVNLVTLYIYESSEKVYCEESQEVEGINFLEDEDEYE